MKDNIESLLEQILVELKTMNARTETAIKESNNKSNQADNLMNSALQLLQGHMPKADK